jgi:hypothetical protein
MKFLKEEHEAIRNLLKQSGLAEHEFSFRKKRGQLFIEIQGRADVFCYYRKTASKLDSNMKFVDETHYYLGAKKETVVHHWDAVLEAIKLWL